MVSFYLSERFGDLDSFYDSILFGKEWILDVYSFRFICSFDLTFSYENSHEEKFVYIYFLYYFKGKIEAGLPTFSLPPFSSQVGNQTYTFFDMCSHYGMGIIVLPLVSVLANVAIAKAFGKKGINIMKILTSI